MASPEPKPGKVRMRKKVAIKEDGRYIIFYTFIHEDRPAKERGKKCRS